MNRQQRKNLAADLSVILGHTVVGSVKYPNLLLAPRRMEEWISATVPSHDERGGSSSPVEVADRQEDRRVGFQALRDLDLFPRLLEDYEQECVIVRYSGPNQSFARTAEQLAALVRRYTVPVDHEKLPDDPGCKSCARPGKVGKRQFQGHPGVPVYEKAKKHGLCRWCYDAFQADGELPPIDVVDLYHRVSARAAGLELAKRAKQKERV